MYSNLFKVYNNEGTINVCGYNLYVCEKSIEKTKLIILGLRIKNNYERDEEGNIRKMPNTITSESFNSGDIYEKGFEVEVDLNREYVWDILLHKKYLEELKHINFAKITQLNNFTDKNRMRILNEIVRLLPYVIHAANIEGFNCMRGIYPKFITCIDLNEKYVKTSNNYIPISELIDYPTDYVYLYASPNSDSYSNIISILKRCIKDLKEELSTIKNEEQIEEDGTEYKLEIIIQSEDFSMTRTISVDKDTSLNLTPYIEDIIKTLKVNSIDRKNLVLNVHLNHFAITDNLLRNLQSCNYNVRFNEYGELETYKESGRMYH